MKSFTRAAVLTCAAFYLAVTFSSTPARADDMNSNLVLTAQMRLASLGYFVGRYDGHMGAVTQNAIMDFQRTHGLPISGQLTPDTYAALASTKPQDRVLTAATYAALPTYAYYNVAYDNPMMVAPMPVVWDNAWHSLRREEIPIRYGKLTVNEDNQGTVRHYAVTLNNQPVLMANNQIGVLRFSKTFALDGEDAVIFTAYQGDGVCAYKSYLLTIHKDGNYNNPREIGNCSSNYEAHVADNALFISFPGMNIGNGWGTWDVWRYENNALARI